MRELIYHRHLLPAIHHFASRTLVVDGEYRATFRQHGARVLRCAGALRQLGLGKGDRFAVMAANCHEYLELYHAAYLGAGIINPLNLRLAGRELDYIVRDSGTEVAFVDRHFAAAFDQAMRAAAGRSPIRRTVLIGGGDVPHDVRYEDLLAGSAPEVPDEPEEDDAVVLMYTGGTTGIPKGVLVSQRAEMLNWYHLAMVFPIGEEQVFLMPTPIFHAASMIPILALPALGGTIVLAPRFDPAETLDLIERHGVTRVSLVPTMLGMILNHPEFEPQRLRSLDSLVYGASPMPEALLARLMELYPNLELGQGYGMTESSSILTLLTPADHRRGGKLLRSVGRALPGIVLSIQDENGHLLPIGETGEVCARGGNYMIGYWNQPDATSEAFRGGWYHSGDAGYLDHEGYLYLVDRVKDMIVTGGENVYSIEVENAISTHPAVAQVAVIGIPHQVWGEAVHAVVVLREGAAATAEEIIAHARASIAGYKVPKSVELRDQPLPLSGAMKVLKRELREPYWRGHTRRIG
ncbi:MAG TPA: AMP-binding protein [Thermoanaerobaculia bacterium]|nr:AMP-binding protein [Thermoanaerobaculia bacterium]